MRRVILRLAVAATFAFVTAGCARPDPLGHIREAAQVAWGPDRTRAKVIDAAATLRAAIADPRFAKLPVEDRAAAYSGAGWAALYLRDPDRSRAMLARSVELAPGDSFDRLQLARLQWDHDEKPAALSNTLRCVREGAELGAEDSEFIWAMVRSTDPDAPDRLALLEALFVADWDPRPAIASNLKYQLALARVRAGHTEGLREVVQGIDLPDLVVMLRSDKRFDSAVDRDSLVFDAKAAANLQVNRLERPVADPPAADRDTTELLRAMLVAGRTQEVATLSSAALAHAGKNADPGEVASILEQQSLALLRLGRVPDAVVAQEKAAAISLDGAVNVNQTLDLGGLYCELGRGDDAARAARRVEANINPFGRVVQSMIEHCAATLTGDKAAAARALAYLEAHKQERAPLYLDALLRENRMDAAAAAFLATLEDELTRGDTLASVQTYADTPDLSPSAVAQADRWKALLARRDVADAIAKVGRIEAYDIYP
jgi:tetratricopeptide (TPR) repeat protein